MKSKPSRAPGGNLPDPDTNGLPYLKRPSRAAMKAMANAAGRDSDKEMAALPPEVVAYIRVSTDHQETGQQRQALNDWSMRTRRPISHFYTDTASGGVSWQERALAAALDNVRRGDTIVVSEISRIARSTTGVLGFMEAAAKKGVNVISVAEGITFDDSIGGQVMVTMFAMVAQIERTLLRQRTRNALMRRAAAGVKLGRPVGSKGPSILDARRPEIEKLLSLRVSKRAIARMMECSPGTLYAFLKRTENGDAFTLPLPLEKTATKGVQ